MTVLETERLRLRRVEERDASFLLELVNDADWKRFIGDRGVRTLEDARAYVRRAFLAAYESRGFGLYAVEHRSGGGPMGICGLVKRDALEDVDLGFAFLLAFRGRGYARESAEGVLAHAKESLGLTRVAAIVSPDNAVSIALLERLGFVFERRARLAADQPEVRLFARTL